MSLTCRLPVRCEPAWPPIIRGERRERAFVVSLGQAIGLTKLLNRIVFLLSIHEGQAGSCPGRGEGCGARAARYRCVAEPLPRHVAGPRGPRGPGRPQLAVRGEWGIETRCLQWLDGRWFGRGNPVRVRASSLAPARLPTNARDRRPEARAPGFKIVAGESVFARKAAEPVRAKAVRRSPSPEGRPEDPLRRPGARAPRLFRRTDTAPGQGEPDECPDARKAWARRGGWLTAAWQDDEARRKICLLDERLFSFAAKFIGGALWSAVHSRLSCRSSSLSAEMD